MTLKTGKLIAVAAIFALVLAACSSASDEAAPTTAPPPATAPAATPTSSPLPTPPPAVQQDGDLITAAEGGRVFLGDPDNPVIAIEIPPGALTADTAISIQILAPDSLNPDAGSLESVGATYQLNPAGLRFNAPVTITLRLDAAELGGIDVEAGIRPLLGLLRSEDGTWDLLRESVTTANPDSEAMILSGQTDHFTELVVVNGPLKVGMIPAKVGPIPAKTAWSVDMKATNLSSQEQINWSLDECKIQGVVRTIGEACPFGASTLAPGRATVLPTHSFECATTGAGTWEIRVGWKESNFLPARADVVLQFVPVVLEEASGSVVLLGQAECIAPSSPPTPVPEPTNTPTPEPVAFVDFPALEPEFVDCFDGTPIPPADAPEIIKAGEVLIRVGQNPGTFVAVDIDMQAIVARANQTGEGLPSIQILIRDNDGPPLPDSPDWHFDNIYHNTVQLFLGDKITAYLQDVLSHELVELPTFQATLEDGRLMLKLRPDIFPSDPGGGVGIISPDAAACAEYIFDGFEGSVIPEPQSIDVPRVSSIPYEVSTNTGSSRVNLLSADLDCDTQPELYQVDDFGRWRDVDLLGEDLGDEPLFSTPPGASPFAGDWNGDGCDAPGAFFGDGSGLTIFYSRAGEPSERKFVNAGDIRLPDLMVGGRPVVGDFDGDGIDDLGTYRDGIFRLSRSEYPLLDDLSQLARPAFDLEIFQFGGLGSAPLSGVRLGFLNDPGGDEVDEKDDFALVLWDDAPVSGCAPTATPCGVVIRFDWWEASGMAAFIIDANGDGSLDLLACPAGEDGLVASGPLDCWLIDDFDAFIDEALFP